MKTKLIGKTLVFGDGTRRKIVGIPQINGRDGVLTEKLPGDCLPSDQIYLTTEILKWVGLGVWKLEDEKLGKDKE